MLAFRKSFTLIELLIVIALIAVLAGVSLPRMSQTFSSAQFQGFVGDFQAVMNYLHQRSVMEGKIFALQFEAGLNQYLTLTPQSENSERVYVIPRDISLESDRQEILFYPDGTIDDAVITARGPGEQLATFITEGVYGGIKVQLQ